MRKRPINYKGWNPGVDGKVEFKLRLKYGECVQCKSVMWCKWGCTQRDYPHGMRDFNHPRWVEVAQGYLDTLIENDFDISDDHTLELIEELQNRGQRN